MIVFSQPFEIFVEKKSLHKLVLKEWKLIFIIRNSPPSYGASPLIFYWPLTTNQSINDSFLHMIQLKIEWGERSEEERRLLDRLERGRPVLHEVGAANKHHLSGSIFEDPFCSMAGKNLSLLTSS